MPEQLQLLLANPLHSLACKGFTLFIITGLSQQCETYDTFNKFNNFSLLANGYLIKVQEIYSLKIIRISN